MRNRSGKFGPDISKMGDAEILGIAFRSFCFECGCNLKRHMGKASGNTLMTERTGDGRSKFICSKCSGMTPEKFQSERHEWDYKSTTEVPKEH